MGKDQPRSRLKGSHRLFAGCRPDSISRQTEIQSRGLRLHHLHRQQRSTARIDPLVRANYLASPPLVVAYALAGRMDLELTTEPLGTDQAGKPVYLREIWPTPQEVESTVRAAVSTEQYRKEYSEVFEGDARWKAMPVPVGDLYKWEENSTYIKLPPYFENMPKTPGPLADIRDRKSTRLNS